MAVLAALAVPANAAVTVAITGPASVTPSSTFDLELQVTQAGSAFNAFDAIVAFDPAVLTPVVLSPLSLQEGSLMTSACGTRFHRFRPGVGRDTISLSLLCNGVTVAGPGTVYRLRFLAPSTPQVTTIQFFATPRFYNAGIQVAPVVAQDLNLGIGVTVDVGAGAPSAEALRIHASPNPARSRAWFSIRAPEPGPATLEITDVTGRVVRRLDRITLGAGEHAVEWDGRCEWGDRARAGLYFARLRCGERVTGTTLVWTP